jgi:hypothetical protein
MTKLLTKNQRALLDRITETLANMDCNYAITLPDGEEVTNIISAEPRRKRSLYALGEQREYIKNFLSEVEPGQFAEVPFDKWPSANIQGGISAYCRALWGRGTFTTSINRANKTIEVLRTGGL